MNDQVNSRRLLHVGCGTSPHDRLPAVFRTSEWSEVRFDIDPGVRPDILGSITDMSMIANASIDAIWSSHNLEHLSSFAVPVALSEFLRVLRPDGYALITVPDVRSVACHIASTSNGLVHPLYNSAAGPISALDIIFGHQASIAAGNAFMEHRTAFTSETLGEALSTAGFRDVRVREGSAWDLWAVASPREFTRAALEELSGVVE